ncbi:calcium-independent phospholipase A2-gamma-like [Tubulanus polymorphus]|uniref:calcium-independent phospholipase A2-gamma-like n=1 Tax=Tubulanus polymorphus TaxID=672921 RepID=UPI003DA409C2
MLVSRSSMYRLHSPNRWTYRTGSTTSQIDHHSKGIRRGSSSINKDTRNKPMSPKSYQIQGIEKVGKLVKFYSRNVRTLTSKETVINNPETHNKSWSVLRDLVKSVSALNLELQKRRAVNFLSDYEKYLPSAFRMKSPKNDVYPSERGETSLIDTVGDVHKKDTVSDDMSKCTGPNTDITNSPRNETKAVKSDINMQSDETFVAKPEKNDFIRKDLTVSSREQHNFEQAMCEMADSDISDFDCGPKQSVHLYFTKVSSMSNSASSSPSEFGVRQSAKVDDENSDKKPKSTTGKSGVLATVEPFVERVRDIIPSFSGKSSVDSSKPKIVKKKANVVTKADLNRRTRALVTALKTTESNMSRVTRLEELSKHLLAYPEARSAALKTNITSHLLRIRHTKDKALLAQINETLAILGHVDPVKGKGIRLLTLDGGGTRGLIAVEILRKIEAQTGRKVYELFDYICGVSTGSLLAIFLGVYRLPLDKIEQIYKEFSADMFSRNTLIGAGKLFLNHAYYDTDLWIKILKKNIGHEKTLIESARESICPKICAVSTLVNVAKLRHFIFRNYNLPSGVQSHFDGTCKYRLWEAIRASSAAPGYFEEFPLGDDVHQDGGILTNNPTAIGIHECKLLWPNEDFQCVMSIGNGRYEPTDQGDDPAAYHKSVTGKLTKIVQSATDTEAVHTMMYDLLPPSIYFRFNPYLSEEFQLDEIRPDKLELMNYETRFYCRKNEQKLKRACEKLAQPRQLHQKATDYVNLKVKSLNS